MIGWRSLRDESKADLNGGDLFHTTAALKWPPRRAADGRPALPPQLPTTRDQPKNAGTAFETSAATLAGTRELEGVTPCCHLRQRTGERQINGEFPAEHVAVGCPGAMDSRSGRPQLLESLHPCHDNTSRIKKTRADNNDPDKKHETLRKNHKKQNLQQLKYYR